RSVVWVTGFPFISTSASTSVESWASTTDVEGVLMGKAGRAGGAGGRSAIVVGGGIGGLAAGVALTRSGWQVQVLERAATCGAAVRRVHRMASRRRHRPAAVGRRRELGTR